MGNASSIHQFSSQDACSSLSAHFLKDSTYLNQLQPIYTTPNIFHPNSRSNSARKNNNSHRALPTLKKQRVIKIDSGNLNKAILLRIISQCNTARQPDFDDCNVPVTTEGSQGITKAHCTNQLLNKLDFENFDGDKTTTNSLDTSCLKHSPKANIFHPPAMYFNYEKTQDNEVVQLINGQTEMTQNISLDPPLRTKEDYPMPPRHTSQSGCNSSRFPNKENTQNTYMLSNREKLYTRESPRQSLELTPQKQHQGESAIEDRPTRRLCLKSRSANRQKSQEVTTESDSEKSYLPFQGDPLLRNYGMISEYTAPTKIERLLNSDSKASPLPSGRLTHDKNEENDERSSSRRNSMSKPVPKHRLLLQASKMKRERSCEALSSARRSAGTRDTVCNEPNSARPITNRTDVPLPVFSSPDKPELSITLQQQQQQCQRQDYEYQQHSQPYQQHQQYQQQNHEQLYEPHQQQQYQQPNYEQQQNYQPYQQHQQQNHEQLYEPHQKHQQYYEQQQYLQKEPEQQHQQQVEAKWEDFYSASNQMKKEMDEFKKVNEWVEEQKEVINQKSQRQTIDFSHDVSPITLKDNHITHFSHATLSFSHSIPHYTGKHNRTLSQDIVHNFGEALKESAKENNLSPLKPEENHLSPLKEESKYLSPPKDERLNTKEEAEINVPGQNHGESFNTQHFGTGTIDFQGLHLKDCMESFDPPSSCYESNLTSQLEKEREIFVVDLLAKDNNSEYNREHYQSVLSDINQKIDGILRKCCVITERSNKSFLHPTPVSVSPNPTFIAGPGEMILDDPTLINMSQAKGDTVRNSPEKTERFISEEDLRDGQPNEIEDIMGYSDALTKKQDIQGFKTMKDDLFIEQAVQPQINEDIQQENLTLEDENKSLEAEDKLEISREFEVNEDDLIQNYEQPKNVLHNVVEENEEETKEEESPKDLKENEEEEEQKIQAYDKIRTEGSLVMIRKTLENEEEDKKESLLHHQYATGKFDNLDENEKENDTFTLESENGNDSMYDPHATNKQGHEEKLQEDIAEQDKLENSFTQELASHRARNEDIEEANQDRAESPVEQMQEIEIKCSPKRDSPQGPRNYDSPIKHRENSDWDHRRYPSVEIQRAAEELETLTKALNNLPQNPENFVSTAGLQSVKKIIMEKIEGIHVDILERIHNLNKKIETKSPLAKSPLVNNRRDSVISQEQTQDTRLDCSAETHFRRMMFSVRDDSRAPYSYSSQVKTDSQPQSYCPSPFQSQPREQSQNFEPGLTFGQGNAELKGYYERAALAKMRKGHQKERSIKFEPKQVSLSILNLVDTSADTSVCNNSTNNKSMINSRIDKSDKHHQSIRQIADHSTASKPSSPLSYRSSLLKTATRDGVMKATRSGKSIDKDAELESILSGTLRRDSSNEKDNKKHTKNQNSHRGILSSQQTRQDQVASEKEIREAFNSRQPNSPFYMSHLLGTDSTSQKSRRGSYSEVKNVNPMNRSDEMWVQEEIEKKKKLAVELMNLSSLRKSRELEMPEDCMRKMEEWARSETSSWSQIPTVREKKTSSQGVLKLQDYLAGEGKLGVRELNEYPLSTLLNRENQESVDTIFEEEFDSKRTTTRDQGVQTVNVAPENFYFKQRKESKENGRGIASLQNSMLEHSRSMSSIMALASKGNQSQFLYDMNTSVVAKTPERKSVKKNIHLNDMEMFSKKRVGGESEGRSASRIKKGDVNRTLEKQASASKLQKSGEKVKLNKVSTERTLSGLPRVSKSVRNNAVAISELMQAYVLEQKERNYK